jgi:SsrA-binding protein
MAGEKLIVDNRRARHDYELLERFEAGLVLTGTEVKSLRQGRVSLGQAFADLREGELWLVGAEIATYDQGNVANHEPARDRKPREEWPPQMTTARLDLDAEAP